jgi:TonB family protein
MNWLGLLEQCAGAATFVLLAAFAASWALHAAPAAWRHFLWTAVLAGLLILPAMVRVMPKWGLEPAAVATAATVAIPVPAEPSEQVTVVAAAPAAPVATAAPAARAWNPVLLAWLAGCALAAVRFLAGWVRTALLVRYAGDANYARQPMDAAGGQGVRVVESAAARTALAAGILRPVVVLPAGADAWPVARLRAALLHEWMHVRRRDLLAQAVAQAACCLYWFHPLAWMAARQMRREREQACDDAVLARGFEARDYAGHLVESARAMRGQHAGAMAMAEPSELERRVRALLDGSRDRRPLSRTAAGAMLAALAMALLPVAAITVHAQAQPAAERADAVVTPRQVQPEAETAISVKAQAQPVPQSSQSIPVAAEFPQPQSTTTISLSDALRETKRRELALAAALASEQPEAQQPQTIIMMRMFDRNQGAGSISGVVQDPSGARIPNSAITLKGEDGFAELNTTSNMVGEYQFPSLQAGRYTLLVSVAGFKRFSREGLSVQANQTSTVNVNLEVGGVIEALTITAPRPAGVAAVTPAADGRIRVGGNVQPAKIIRKVAPAYPQELRAQGIAGTVHLSAIINKEGKLTDIQPLKGPDPGLIAAAVDAASQWQYQPSLLNGEPVAVLTQIDITFELK